MMVGTDKAKIRVKITKLKTGKSKTVTSYYENGIEDLAKDIAELIEKRHKFPTETAIISAKTAKKIEKSNKELVKNATRPLSKFKEDKKKVKK